MDYLDFFRETIMGVMGMFAMIYVLFKFVFPLFVYKRGYTPPLKERLVADLGNKIMEPAEYCGITINTLNTFAKICLYSEGIWVSPIFMSPFVIRKSEISEINVQKQLIFQNKMLVLKYVSDEVYGPLFIKPGDDEDRFIEIMMQFVE